MKCLADSVTYEPTFLGKLGEEERKVAGEMIKKFQITYFCDGWEVSKEYHHATNFGIFHRCPEDPEPYIVDPDYSTEANVEDILLDVYWCGRNEDGRWICTQCKALAPTDTIEFFSLISM